MMEASNHSPSCVVTALCFQLEPRAQQQPSEMVVPKNSSSFLVDKHKLMSQSRSQSLFRKEGSSRSTRTGEALKIGSFEVLHLFLGAFHHASVLGSSAAFLGRAHRAAMEQGVAVGVSVVPP